jgi:hypothetical protein
MPLPSIPAPAPSLMYNADKSALITTEPITVPGDGLGGGIYRGPYADLDSVVAAIPTAKPADFVSLRTGGFASWNANTASWEPVPSIAPTPV